MHIAQLFEQKIFFVNASTKMLRIPSCDGENDLLFGKAYFLDNFGVTNSDHQTVQVQLHIGF